MPVAGPIIIAAFAGCLGVKSVALKRMLSLHVTVMSLGFAVLTRCTLLFNFYLVIPVKRSSAEFAMKRFISICDKRILGLARSLET